MAPNSLESWVFVCGETAMDRTHGQLTSLLLIGMFLTVSAVLTDEVIAASSDSRMSYERSQACEHGLEHSRFTAHSESTMQICRDFDVESTEGESSGSGFGTTTENGSSGDFGTTTTYSSSGSGSSASSSSSATYTTGSSTGYDTGRDSDSTAGRDDDRRPESLEVLLR